MVSNLSLTVGGEDGQAGAQFRGGNVEGGDQGCQADCPLEGGACQGWRGIGLLGGLPVTVKAGRGLCTQ